MSDDNRSLIDAWREQPAPVLPLLHAFHERDGYVSDEAIAAIAEACCIPVADLFGTVTFYHHLSREPGGYEKKRVCTGSICWLRGADALLEGMKAEGAEAMACAGRCDGPIPVIERGHVLIAGTNGELAHRRSPLPTANPAGIDECVFGSIRKPGRATLPGYCATGGFVALQAVANAELTSDALLELITSSGLAGRGGAGFPTGRKWQAVRQADGSSKVIVCNADEGEPGCFKDRALLEHDPFAVIEGMVIAALATGAESGFIYLRYEYPELESELINAIRAATESGYCGADILGSGQTFDIHVRRGAGAYICGEETALLNSLEGQHPFPRIRPPFPVTHGYLGRPTVVNNVETLAAVAPIVVNGADWYQGLGHGENAGTKVISLSGDVERPGNYEVPLGMPLMELIEDWAGGVADGRAIQAVTMAGLSGGFLAGDDLGVTLDETSIRAAGSFLGAGGIMVFDETRDMVEAARDAMDFFRSESCGKCFPCRIGTTRLFERLLSPDGLEASDWHTEVAQIGTVMKSTSACGLGMAAPLIPESLVRYFPQAVSRFLTGD